MLSSYTKELLEDIGYDEHWDSVLKFHETYNCPVNYTFTIIDKETFDLRIRLIKEEYDEFISGIEKFDEVEIFDGAIDLIYVTIGSMITFGIEIEVNNEDLVLEPNFTPQNISNYILSLEKISENNYTDMRSLTSPTKIFLRIQIENYLKNILLNTYKICLLFNYPIKEGFREVQRSNMSKLGEDGKPVYRESDGKVLKGPNYSPPDLRSILNKVIEE